VSHQLIRLRKAWCNGVELMKTTSEFSGEWALIPDDEKEILGLTADENVGEFWMSLEDFARNFESVEFCHTDAKLVADFHGKLHFCKALLAVICVILFKYLLLQFFK